MCVNNWQRFSEAKKNKLILENKNEQKTISDNFRNNYRYYDNDGNRSGTKGKRYAGHFNNRKCRSKLVVFSNSKRQSRCYTNGSDSVVSRIQSIGDWELNMLSSSMRTTYINFGEPVNPQDSANAAPPNGYYPVRFLAQCPADLRNLGSGNSQNCKMVIAVNVGTDRYSIRFGYVAETSPTKWTCNSVASSGKCSSWRMMSNTNGTGKIAAQLYKITTSKGKTNELPVGKYSFSFGINVANQ